MRKLAITATAVAAIGLLGVAEVAPAAVVTYYATAYTFVPSSPIYDTGPAPIGPVILDFTVPTYAGVNTNPAPVVSYYTTNLLGAPEYLYYGDGYIEVSNTFRFIIGYTIPYPSYALEVFGPADRFGNFKGSLDVQTSNGSIWVAKSLTINDGDPTAPAPIPEPETWAMMLVGFGLAGAALRRGRPCRLSSGEAPARDGRHVI